MDEKRKTIDAEEDPLTRRKVQGALFAEEVKVRLLSL